jgi:hypothetical protein
VAHVSNASAQVRDVIVRWQLVDYEGERTLAPALDKKVTIAAGKTYSETSSIPLTRTGMVIARLTVLDEKGAEVDHSDFH